MKKYLIFVYGEFSDNDIKRITNNIAPITEGKAFKFLYTQDHIIFHFESSFEMEFIQEFILDTIKDECLMYFMTEYNDSLSIIYLKIAVSIYLTCQVLKIMTWS